MEQETMNCQFQQPRPEQSRSRHRAFTLIELLVTIGIILVLIGIVFVAVKHMSRSATSSSAKIDLQNLQSMLAELELAGPLSTTLLPVNLNAAVVAPSDVNAPTYEATANGTAVGTPALDRWLAPAVLQTQFVMGKLRSVPKNRAAIQSMPVERLMKAQALGKDYSTLTSTPGISTTPANTSHGAPDPQIIVDAWGNPIIFVTNNGLQPQAYDPSSYTPPRFYKKGAVVFVPGTPPKFYRALKEGSPSALGSPANANWEEVAASFAIVTAPGNRPFFASAGPDGDFTTLDDNQYSFEQ